LSFGNRALNNPFIESSAVRGEFNLLRNHFAKSVEIIPDETVVVDRSLDASEFRRKFGYTPPAWPDMIASL
jgi:hypothetical protein